MNDKVQKYVIEALAATGFCVLSAVVAFRLRPDIWATRLECSHGFNDAKRMHEFLQSLLGVQLFEVRPAGSDDWHLLATRSTDGLPARVEHITGDVITGLRPFAPVDATPAPVVMPGESPIPSWPCQERTERLHAAGLKDTQFQEPRRFAPPRRGR